MARLIFGPQDPIPTTEDDVHTFLRSLFESLAYRPKTWKPIEIAETALYLRELSFQLTNLERRYLELLVQSLWNLVLLQPELRIPGKQNVLEFLKHPRSGIGFPWLKEVIEAVERNAPRIEAERRLRLPAMANDKFRIQSDTQLGLDDLSLRITAGYSVARQIGIRGAARLVAEELNRAEVNKHHPQAMFADWSDADVRATVKRTLRNKANHDRVRLITLLVCSELQNTPNEG